MQLPPEVKTRNLAHLPKKIWEVDWSWSRDSIVTSSRRNTDLHLHFIMTSHFVIFPQNDHHSCLFDPLELSTKG